MTKREIRQKMKEIRAGIAHEDALKWSRAACEALLSTEEYKSARSIMLYFPFGNEVDTTLIARAARADGKHVIYPVTDKTSGRITPVLAGEDSRFIQGAFNVYEPCGEVYDEEIELTVIPGVAFDRRGDRLGFGRGCYDGFLAKGPTVKVGLCYEIQLVDELPCEDHDVPMDMIVTESEIIKIYSPIR